MPLSAIFALLFILSCTNAQTDNSRNGCIEENGEEWCATLNQCVLTKYEVKDDDRLIGDLDANGCYAFEQICKSLNNECVLTQWNVDNEQNRMRMLFTHL